jgi:hypothetical protein
LIDIFEQSTLHLKQQTADRDSVPMKKEMKNTIGEEQNISQSKLVEAATVLLDTLKNDSNGKKT